MSVGANRTLPPEDKLHDAALALRHARAGRHSIGSVACRMA